MSDITWGVEHTPMFPSAWYGGPYHNGERHSNATRYYFRSEGEAWDFVCQQRIRELEAANAALVAENTRMREALEMSKQDHRDDLDALALVRRQRDEAVRELKAAFARAALAQPKEPKDV